MNNKHQKYCRTLNFIDHSLIVTSTFTGNVYFSFNSGIPIGITSSAIGLKVCIMTVGIKITCLEIKWEKKHHKMKLLAESNLNGTEVLFSKALIDSNISLERISVERILWFERTNQKF